jgi:hypothetical protein
MYMRLMPLVTEVRPRLRQCNNFLKLLRERNFLMKKLVGTVLICSLLYGNTQSVSAASLSETIKQVDTAAITSRILHENYIRNLDYETIIGTPYNNARLEVGKAKKMVDSLPASEKKAELLKRVASYQKVVQNGNAYNNAVRTNDILEGYSTKYLDPYFSEYSYGAANYNYFNHKLSLLQPNYDKVYGSLIQNEFKIRYLKPIKNTRNQVYYLLNAKEDLNLTRKALDLKNTDETQRQLSNADACLDKISDSPQKKLLIERLALLQKLLEDEVSGQYDTFYITKKYYHGQLSMKVSFNLKGTNMRFWIADAEEYPSYESLKTALGNEVYGYHSSRETDGFIEEFNWTYRDLSGAYHMNIVWGYWKDYLDGINNHNDKIIPAGTDVRIVLEVEQEDGSVIVKEEVVTITEELFQKAHVN